MDFVDTNHLRNHFNWHAAEFDRLYDSGRQTRLGRWLNRRYRSDIAGRYLAALDHVRTSGAQSVLDVGCGPGHYLAALAKMEVPRLVGVDVSEEMIGLARNNPDVGGHRSVELVNADYSKWNSDEKFDVIIALGFFDYVSDPAALLKRMRCQARHSVFASFPSRHWFRMPYRWVRRRLQGTRVYFYTEEEIRRLARDSGYENVVLEKLPGPGMNFVATFLLS